MAVTVIDYLEKIRFVKENIPRETARIINYKREEILDLNRERQLFDKGIDSNGKILTPYYAPYTISTKRIFNLPYNRVTLFQEGNFYKGFKLINRNNVISIFSTDSKSSDLQDKYGSSIFGLTKENQDIYNYQIIKPELDKFIKKYL